METNELKNLIDLLQGRVKIDSTEMEHFVSEMFSIIRQGLEHDRTVKVKGLGVFKLVDVDARESISVNSGERVLIEGHGKITFVPDATMKELVNKPFSQFETVVLNDGVDFKDLETDIEEKDISSSETNINSKKTTSPSFVDDSLSTVQQDKKCITEEKNNIDTNTFSADSKVNIVVENTDNPDGKEGLSDNTISQSTCSEKPVKTDNSDEVSNIDSNTNDSTLIDDKLKDLEEGQNITTGLTKKNRYFKRVGYSLSSIGLLCLSIYGGYLWGYHDACKNSIPLGTNSKYNKEKANSISTDTLIIDSVSLSQETKSQETKILSEDKTNSSDSIHLAKKTTNEVKNSGIKSFNSNVYDSDIRVKTGAYRIIGLNKEIITKTGETLKSISDRTLGLGMECYIEVFNNLPPNCSIKSGQKIKIPELVLKKKVK